MSQGKRARSRGSGGFPAWLVLAFVGVLVVLGLAGPLGYAAANVKYAVDQQYTVTADATSKVEVQGDVWGGITFQPAVTKTCLNVELYCSRAGTPGTVTVEITAVDGSHKPTGAALCSGTFDGADVVASPGKEWRRVTFTTTSSLTAATEYALVVHQVGSEGNDLYWWYDAADTYSRVGNRISTPDAGVNWTVETGSMSLFKQRYDRGGGALVNFYADLGAWFLVLGGVVAIGFAVYKKSVKGGK